MSEDELTLEQFLEDKTDYSHLLVHLTRSDEFCSAKEVLCQILDARTLKAYNPWCICQYDFDDQKDASLREKFKVVCFTETPLKQIKTLLKPLAKRQYTPESYGLVFQKKYIREKGGNPVFYLTKRLARPLRTLFLNYKGQLAPVMYKLLALTTICDEGNDWHWEREWRVVGDLKFALTDVYCGLCPQQDISYFCDNYKPVKFIDPHWGMKRVLDEFVKQEPPILTPEEIPLTDIPFQAPEDIPFGEIPFQTPEDIPFQN